MRDVSTPHHAPAPHRPETAAVRGARARVRARRCFIAGAALIPIILGVFWLQSGRITPLAVAVAVGSSTVFDLFAAAQLVMSARMMQRYKARMAEIGKGAPLVGAPLQIHFCKRSLGRLGPDVTPLLTGLRERGHTPVVKECLNCCQDCSRGLLVTMIDGVPMSAADGQKLLGELDELAASQS